MNKYLFFSLKTIYYMFLYLILSLFITTYTFIFNAFFPQLAYANYESYLKFLPSGLLGAVFLTTTIMFVITLYKIIFLDIKYFRKTKQYKINNILKLKHEVNEESKL